MRHSKVFIFLTSLMLCVCLAGSALAESTLEDLWNSGCNFLFHTDNVTVDGELVFSLDGERFKTAQLHYVQGGFSSYYGLKLLTPRADGTDRETGWTIIADEEGHYDVMEAYEPGVYHSGVGDAFNSLLRRTGGLDALTELGGILLKQVEPLLPEGAVKADEQDGVKTVHIAVTQDQIPEVALSALNLAAVYLSDRWFAYGFDHSYREDERADFENYVTVTQALTDGTVRWTLRAMDMNFDLDTQNRLTRVHGNVAAASTFWDGTVREVEVSVDFAVSDYGESKVKPFDPEEYGVQLPWEFYDDYFGEEESLELDDAAWDEWMARGREALARQGFSVDPEASLGGWTSGSSIYMDMTNPDGAEYFCTFLEDGRLTALQNLTADWLYADEKEADQADADTVAATEKLIRDFLAEENPLLAKSIGGIAVQTMIETEDGALYLTFSDEEHVMAYFVVCAKPTPHVEYFVQMTDPQG